MEVDVGARVLVASGWGVGNGQARGKGGVVHSTRSAKVAGEETEGMEVEHRRV